MIRKLAPNLNLATVGFALSVWTLGWVAGTSTSQAAESIFPKTVTAQVGGVKVRLEKTGEATRNFFLFQVYRMAHYAPPGFKGSVLKSKAPKQINIVFSREIDGERIRNDFKKSLKERVSPKEWKALASSVAAFCNPITQGVKKGDKFVLDWLPGGTITSRFNGKILSRVKNPEFARALWSIWFGSDSVVDRDDLLRDLT